MTSIGAELDAIWQAAQARSPSIELACAAFVTRASALPRVDVAQHADDLYLALACLTNDRNAIAVFEQRVLAPAVLAVRKIDSADAFVDEVRQALRDKLLFNGGQPKLLDYQARGPLAAWARMVAVRLAFTLKRRTKVTVSVDDWIAGAVASGTPYVDVMKQQQIDLFTQALSAAATELEPRLRAVLRMHFKDGLSIDQIGEVYQVHRATTARWLVQAKASWFAKTRSHMMKQQALSDTEYQQLAHEVQSRLDLSLSKLLPAATEL